MIHKVNRPPILSLVPPSKKMENDPGGSQGSGNFYEGPPSGQNPNSESAKKPETLSEESRLAPEALAVVVNETMGMTEVMTEFLEQKKSEIPVNPGLATRYTSDSQTAKGLLLNKKAE